MKKIVCQNFQDVFDNLKEGNIFISPSWSGNKKIFIFKTKDYFFGNNLFKRKYYYFPQIYRDGWFQIHNKNGRVESDWIIYKL